MQDDATGAPADWDAVVIHPGDDVAVALRPLAPGEARVRECGAVRRLHVREAIPVGHKLALHSIAAGALVRKYGEPIGAAVLDIAEGAHVHVHNVRSRRAQVSVRESTSPPPQP